jgi:hypothetical protein
MRYTDAKSKNSLILTIHRASVAMLSGGFIAIGVPDAVESGRDLAERLAGQKRLR